MSMQDIVFEMEADQVVSVNKNSRGIVIELASGAFFKPGSAQLRKVAVPVLQLDLQSCRLALGFLGAGFHVHQLAAQLIVCRAVLLSRKAHHLLDVCVLLLHLGLLEGGSQRLQPRCARDVNLEVRQVQVFELNGLP